MWHKCLTIDCQELILLNAPRLLLCLLPLSAAADVVVPVNTVDDHVNVRLYPNAESERVGQLHKGDFAELVRSDSGWHEIEIAGGATGYISSDWTIVLESAALVGEITAEIAEDHALTLNMDVSAGPVISEPNSAEINMAEDSGDVDNLLDFPDAPATTLVAKEPLF
jgi:hypothetical protein